MVGWVSRYYLPHCRKIENDEMQDIVAMASRRVPTPFNRLTPSDVAFRLKTSRRTPPKAEGSMCC